MAEQRNCPKCDTLMDYRLGEYECPSCGHSEGALPDQSQGSRGKSGPGFIQTAPPPQSMPTPGMQGSRFGNYMGNPLDTPGGGIADTLETEKNVFIWIRGGMWALLLGTMLVMTASIGPVGGGFDGLMWGIFAILMIYALVDMGLLLFVLKSDQVWAKYCCMGCMGLRFLAVLFNLFAPDLAAQAGPAPDWFDAILGAVTVLFDIWFFSILYRDATNPGY